MPTERITFPGHAGNDLSARLDLPDGPVLATALFAHCFTCGKDIPAARRISARLSAMGIAVLRFDFTGLGHSDGEFGNTTFTSNVDDLLAACRYLDGRGMAPSMLIGHSLGGAAVLKAGSQIETIKAVITLGAPFDPEHVTHNFADALPEIMEKGAAEVTLGGRPFRMARLSSKMSRQASWHRPSPISRPPFWSCTRRVTPSSASTTPARYSSPPNTPKALSHSMTPIT